MEAILHGKALAWGGSIGIRISKAEAERLGIRVGQELDLKLLPSDYRLDVSHFHTFHDGQGADDHDRIYGEGVGRSLGLKDRP